MPFVQTMPIMRLGHSVPKVKLSSCQFPLYAYLALSMAFFGFKICLNCLFSRTKRAEKSKTCLDACHEVNCAHKKARKHIYMSTTSMVSHERVVGALS